MAFFQQPSGTVVSGAPFVQQPALQLADTSGNVVRQAGTLVRATLLDAPGQLLNDVAVTNSSGLAIFEQLTFLPANAFPPATLRLRFTSGAQAAVTTGNVNIQPPQASAVRSVAYGTTAQRLFVLDPGQTMPISAVARDLVGQPLANVSMVYSSASSSVASVSSSGAITGVGSGSTWVRAFGAGQPGIMDSVYITVTRDPTAPVIATTQIAPIPMRDGVSAGFEVVLDTRDAIVGAATIVISMPTELVNGISWQGASGTIISVDSRLNALRISFVSASGVHGHHPDRPGHHHLRPAGDVRPQSRDRDHPLPGGRHRIAGSHHAQHRGEHPPDSMSTTPPACTRMLVCPGDERAQPSPSAVPVMSSSAATPRRSNIAPVRARRARGGLTALVLSIAVLAGCNDERAGVSPPRPVPLPVASNAWFVISDSTAVAGREVSIAAFASSDSGGAIGSFTARFLYDSLQLQVLGPDSIADQAMRAINPIAGEHRIAGASAQGMPNGLLFRLRAKVIDPRGLRRLGLIIDEMHSVQFADLTAKLQVRDTRAALFAGRPGLKVQPDEPKQP